jgi:hypothetical protein
VEQPVLTRLAILLDRAVYEPDPGSVTGAVAAERAAIRVTGNSDS